MQWLSGACLLTSKNRINRDYLLKSVTVVLNHPVDVHLRTFLNARSKGNHRDKLEENSAYLPPPFL